MSCKKRTSITGVFSLLLLLVTFIAQSQPVSSQQKAIAASNEDNSDRKLVIYQMVVRLFGNKNTTNKYYGSVEENGTGKFNDITDKALEELKKMGVSHVWYTGVLNHATMTDHTALGIPYDDPDVVKGKAGSPYAIKDYYDVDPDLAVNAKNRMKEYEALINRTHAHGLKMLMDFIPNHVARTYHSSAKPAGVKDFGADDDTTKAFDPKNDFYYIPGQTFVVPEGVNAGGADFHPPMKDGKYNEHPAKATGNNVFSPKPSIDDWYETVKLNYGADYGNGGKTYFEPVPPLWLKMRDILLFWAHKKIDGFRCDMAEMVPLEFWKWVIPQVKKAAPTIIFIGEAYDPKKYQTYLTIGGFDFLYDKVGLYDALKRLIKDEPKGDAKEITQITKEEKTFSSHMLRFLENHDEERVASAGFAKDPWLAAPTMIVTATLGSGPVMIYFGQEAGEPAKGKEGFGGDDNRTSIFDYWGVPEHQKWMNGGKFDGGGLTADQKRLRSFYVKLLNDAASNPAIRSGKFYELDKQKDFTAKNYAYLRYTAQQRILVVANFDRTKSIATKIFLPDAIKNGLHLTGKPLHFKNLLNGETFEVRNINAGIPVKVPPADAWMLSF